MIESVELVRAGTAPKIVQDETKKTYESWCRKADVEVDWSKTAAEIHNLIRGADPAPGAWTRIGGKTVQLFDSRLAAGSGAPGEIVAVGVDGVVIAAIDGCVRLGRLRPDGGAKIAAAEAGLTTGSRCGKR